MSPSFDADRRKQPRSDRAKRIGDKTRLECEMLIDQALEETFPASDPPAYGSLAERIRVLSEGKVL
jgi:hypothetical protein